METTNTFKHKTIKPDSLIKIEVGSAFYERLQNLLYWMYENNQEKLLLALDKLTRNVQVETELEEHTVTMVALLSSIEQQADKQGFVETSELKMPKKD